MVPILSQINPVHTIPSYLFKIKILSQESKQGGDTRDEHVALIE
jgi:hypothetical protein